MHRPKLACPNLLSNSKTLKEFALDHGFEGIDWTLRPENFPSTSSERTAFIDKIQTLRPLEVRYHCFFVNAELGDSDRARAQAAFKLFHDACLLVSRVGGHFITVHVGLGRDSTEGLSWDSTITGLRRLVELADDSGLRICLENLANGWTSRPKLFRKLLGASGCRGTLDIGHARQNGQGVEDFILGQLECFRNAHIYQEENPIRGHVPPASMADIVDRLRLVRRLPLCDWWVLELRTETNVLQTLSVIREFFEHEVTRQAV